VIIYDDSTFKIFKDAEGHKTSIKPIKLEDVVLDLAFGKAASKYGAPPIIGDEHNFIAPNNFIAIPETKERQKIHWFAAKDEHSLNEIMQVIAETVAGKVRPPQMGKGPKGRYFNQDENEKWVTYWNAQQTAAETPGDENGAGQHPAAIAAHQPGPPVAKAVPIPVPPAKEEKKKFPPKVTIMDMPTTIGTLRREADYNLREEHQSDEVPVVRLVNGKRVKETVVKSPTNSNTPPLSSTKISTPTAMPIHISHIQQDYKNGQKNGDHHRTVPKYEISTYVIAEPETTTSTNISISAPVKEHFTKHQQHEEIVTDNQKTIINVGSAERMVSTIDNAPNGITYTSTTKESSFHRSTVRTSNE